MDKKLLIIGAGAWGQALAFAAERGGSQVLIHDRSHPLEESMAFSPYGILAVPTQELRALLTTLALWPEKKWAFACKGMEKSTGLFPTEIGKQILPSCHFAFMSGPNLSKEVREAMPCGLTIASQDSSLSASFASFFQGSRFLIQCHSDERGLEIVAALKNVLAIGYGLVRQVHDSDNWGATFLTMAFHELLFLMEAWGGKKETIWTFGGIGDILATSYSSQGRNRQFGDTFPHPPSSLGLVEGIATLQGLLKRAKPSWSLPMLRGIGKVLAQDLSVTSWVHSLETCYSTYGS